MKQISKAMLELQCVTDMYIDKILNLSLSRFKWMNLPTAIDPAFIERNLLTHGKLCFFYDDVLEQYLMLPFSNESTINEYGNPINIIAIGLNEYKKQLKQNEFCIVWDNILRYNPLQFINYYSKRLAEIDFTTAINLNAQKTPIIYTAPENMKLTTKNLSMQYSTYQNEIFCYDNVRNSTDISVLKTDSPYLIDKLRAEKKEVYAELYEHLGISANVQKNERMIVDEMKNELSVVERNIKSELLARQQGCEQINNRFNLNIGVDLF